MTSTLLSGVLSLMSHGGMWDARVVKQKWSSLAVGTTSASSVGELSKKHGSTLAHLFLVNLLSIL